MGNSWVETVFDPRVVILNIVAMIILALVYLAMDLNVGIGLVGWFTGWMIGGTARYFFDKRYE